jgi:hypothetical protein
MQINAVPHAGDQPPAVSRWRAAMSIGESAVLVFIIAAFIVFAATLAWESRH